MEKISLFGSSSKRLDAIAAKLDEILKEENAQKEVHKSILDRIEQIEAILNVSQNFDTKMGAKLDLLISSISKAMNNSRLFEPETMLIKDAEDYSGLKADTLRKYIAKGVIKAQERTSNKTKLRVIKESLDKYIGKSKSESNEEESCCTQENL